MIRHTKEIFFIGIMSFYGLCFSATHDQSAPLYLDPTSTIKFDIEATGKKLYHALIPLTSLLKAPPAPLPIHSPLDHFTPTHMITAQTQKDLDLLEKMRPLFFERRSQDFFETMHNTLFGRDPDRPAKDKVYAAAIKAYGGQEVMLLTEDDYRISTLCFTKQNAPLNILYVVGYFRGYTPSKEWAAPFSQIFPEYNTFSFDWRGYCDSSGKPENFDSNAYKDIQAVMNYIKKINDKPIVVVGFCLGGAILLKYIDHAMHDKKLHLPHALVLNSLPSRVRNMKGRVAHAAPNVVLQKFFSYKLAQDYLLERMVGDLFTLEPIETLKNIKIPVLLEYYLHDNMVPITEGIENFHALQGKKMITCSKLGSHVRIHSKAPDQYRGSFLNFLSLCGLTQKSK